MNIPEFGKKRSDEIRRDGGFGIVFNPKTQKFAVGEDDIGGLLRFFSGGVEKQEDIQKGILREVKEESGLYDFLHVENVGEVMTHYHNSLKKLNRVAKTTCLLIVLKSSRKIPTRLESHERFLFKWVSDLELRENWDLRNEQVGLDHWFYFLGKAINRLTDLGYVYLLNVKVKAHNSPTVVDVFNLDG